MNLCLVTIITVIFFLKNENFGTASFLTQTVSTRRLKATCSDALEEWAKQVRGNQKTGRQMGSCGRVNCKEWGDRKKAQPRAVGSISEA